MAEFIEAFSLYVPMLALALTRIAVAFLVIPVLNREGMPGLFKCTLFLTLGLVSIATQPISILASVESSVWLNLFLKEIVVGLILGVFFGLFLWAFEAAGAIIDSQIGANYFYLSAHNQESSTDLTSKLLSRWMGYLFIASGGLMLLVGALLESFALWPLTEPFSSLNTSSIRLFETEFSEYFSLALRIAGPLVVVLFAVDICVGLVSRYYPQVNVFSLSMSLKAIAMLIIMLALLPFLTDVLTTELGNANATWKLGIERVFNL